MSTLPTGPHPAECEASGVTVLVVDDTPDNLALISDLLKDEFRVKVANSGERALRITRAETPPDLILLDVMMPELDGYEVCARLKADPQTRDIPVIFLTALTEERDERRGLELGAVDYITKPISPPILQARVRSHVALHVQARRLDALARQLSHYLSPQIYQEIFEGRQRPVVTARRKKLTIVMTDIRSFTDTSEQMQPEDLTALLNEYFSEMSAIALAHGATIDKFVGDAMLMFFGDPESLGEQEDALQAVRMAVAMQRRLAQLRRQWSARGIEQPFHVRIGINTGFCHVGNFGSMVRMDYTAIGAEVNLAARLEQACEPDGVLLSFETWALVKEEFTAEELPPIRAKGIAREIRCFLLRDLDTLDAGDPVIALQTGLSLRLEPGRLAGEARRHAIASLRRALDALGDPLDGD